MRQKRLVLGMAAAAALGLGVAPASAGIETHSKVISLNLTGHLVASGHIESTKPACERYEPVQIQKRRADGTWIGVKWTDTNYMGDYSTTIPDQPGRYRAKTPRQSFETGVTCTFDKSARRGHTH